MKNNIEKRLLYRLKKLAYSSFECGYFAGFLPLRFLQHDYLYFDQIRCMLLIGYLFINSFAMLFANELSTSFNELYLQSQMLGCWRSYSEFKDPKFLTDKTKRTKHEKKEKENMTNTEELDGKQYDVWSPNRCPYLKGSIVTHKNKVYIAIGERNTAEPGHLIPYFLFVLFAKPERTHKAVVMVQAIVVVSQLALVFNSKHVIVYGIMLLLNYNILYYLCISTKEFYFVK